MTNTSFNSDDMLTVREAARFLKVSERTVIRWRKENRIPCCVLSSRKIYYSKTELEEFLQERIQDAKDYDL